MISKFTPIVKLKKEELDRVQRELSVINFKIQAVQAEHLQIKTAMLGIGKPQSGQAALFRQYAYEHQSMQNLLHQKELQLHQLMSEQNRVQHEVNTAFQEFEKFSYLHAQEEKQRILHIKRLEANQLDEVAQMTFNRKRER